MSESASTRRSRLTRFAASCRCGPPGAWFPVIAWTTSNPVNHFLHVGVGWPMVAISILILPFRPLWSPVLFVAAYAIMFFGHFVFERNTPTIFKEPSTPFVIAGAVIRDLWNGALRLARLARVR